MSCLIPSQYTSSSCVTGTLLVAGHFAEVVVWAHTYDWVGAAPPGTDLVYFAFGNYTTLGYADVIPPSSGDCSGPMTALNGIMLIGWSTALIIEILRRSAEPRRPDALTSRPHAVMPAKAGIARPRFASRAGGYWIAGSNAKAMTSEGAHDRRFLPERFFLAARLRAACSWRSPYFMPSSFMPSGSRKNTA